MAVTTLTFSIPQAQTPRVVHALCAASGLPESPANAKQAVIDWMITTVRNVEQSEAQAAALAAIPVATNVTPS